MNQKVLIHLNDQRLHTIWQQRVFTKLLGLQYHIVYKKGIDNSATDALSRRVHPEETCAALSVVTPQWSADIVEGYKDDPQTLSLLAKLAVTADAVPHFTLADDLLKYKNKNLGWSKHHFTTQDHSAIA